MFLISFSFYLSHIHLWLGRVLGPSQEGVQGKVGARHLAAEDLEEIYLCSQA